MSIEQKESSLRVSHISFAYPGYEPVFRDISFEVKPGEVVCILGPNGAGKTTLLNCLANLKPRNSGEIYIDGRNMSQMSPREIAQNVGYVPQIIMPSFDFTVLDYVVTGCAPRMGALEKPRQEHFEMAMKAIQDMGIEHLAEKSYMHISGGERQQVAIARVLAQRPRFILMDEPTAHLDYGNQIKVLITIKKLVSQGFGVLLTTHNPDYGLLLDDKVAVLNRQGSLIFGTGRDILTEEVLTDLYRTPLRLIEEEQVGRVVCIAPKLEDMAK